MMLLTARSGGIDAWLYFTGVSEVAPGRVLAVYRRSLLWLAAPERPLTLSPDPDLRGPLTLEVTAPPGWLKAVTPGMEVWQSGNQLLVGSALRISLSRMTLHDPPLPCLSPARAEALMPLLPPADPPAADPSALLGEGLRTGAPTLVAKAVRTLVGLGPGLTPAGDDFLAGLLAALQARQARERELLAAAIAPRLRATTLISRRLLSWALQGRYGEVIRQLFDESVPSDQAVAALLATGATSGADTAAGIRFGLELVTSYGLIDW